MTTKVPTKVELQPGELHIRWNDGSSTRHSMAVLRKLCPCATCRAEREKMQKPGPVLRVIQTGPAVQEANILEVTPVGRYALSFRWNDGHHTGIYSYDFLLEHAVQA